MRSNPLFLSVLGALATGALVASAASGCGSDSDDGGAGATSGGDCTPPAACTDVVSECIAQEDNTGSETPGLRMSYLTITTPEALAKKFVKQLVLDAVLLDKAACYLDGEGTFSWLLQFDKATGTLKTGGAAASANPE